MKSFLQNTWKHRAHVVMALPVFLVLFFNEKADNYFGGLCLGITLGMMIVGVIMTSKYATKIREYKMRLIHKGNRR